MNNLLINTKLQAVILTLKLSLYFKNKEQKLITINRFIKFLNTHFKNFSSHEIKIATSAISKINSNLKKDIN